MKCRRTYRSLAGVIDKETLDWQPSDFCAVHQLNEVEYKFATVT